MQQQLAVNKQEGPLPHRHNVAPADAGVNLCRSNLFSDDFSWSNMNGEPVRVSQLDHLTSSDAFQRDLIQGKLGCQSCVEENEPTPVALVTHRLRTVINLISRSSLGKRTSKTLQISLIKATLDPYDQVMKSASNDNNMDAFLRRIQMQVLFRFEFWASLGENFVRHYTKLKLVRKRKRAQRLDLNPEGGLIGDIIDLLSLAATKLPQSRPFHVFLYQCLDKSFYRTNAASQLPKETFQKIFTFFEIANEEELASLDCVSFTLQPLPLRRKKKNAGVSSMPLNGDNTSTESSDQAAMIEQFGVQTKRIKPNTPKEDDNLVPNSVALFAPASRKRNSLLANNSAQGHRARFVGSHFNTNLSNASSLFREVKTGKKSTTIPIKKPVSNSQGQPARQSARTNWLSKPNPQNVTALKDKKVLENQHSKRKQQVACFQTSNTSKPTKIQKVSFSGSVPLPSTKLSNKPLARETTLDIHAARRVVFAARSALKRQN